MPKQGFVQKQAERLSVDLPERWMPGVTTIIEGHAEPFEIIKFTANFEGMRPQKPADNKTVYADRDGAFAIEYTAPLFKSGEEGIERLPETVYCRVSRAEANIGVEMEYKYPLG